MHRHWALQRLRTSCPQRQLHVLEPANLVQREEFKGLDYFLGTHCAYHIVYKTMPSLVREVSASRRSQGETSHE